MAKDKNEGSGKPIQPSGPSPLEVTLDGTILGKNITSFENLIVNSMSQLIYGANDGKSRVKLADIGSMAKKDRNPVYLLSSINKKVEGFEKTFKKNSEQQLRIVDNLEVINRTLVGFCQGIVKAVEQSKPRASSSGDGGMDHTLSVILEGSNVDEVFHSLAEIADDNIVYKLGDAFKLLVDNTPKLNEFGKDIEFFSTQIEKLANMTNGFETTTEIIEMLSDKITSLEVSISSVKKENIESFVNCIQSLAKINVQNADIEALKQFLTSINNANIDIKKFSDLTSALGIVKSIQDLETIDSKKITDANKVLHGLQDTINFINNIEDIKNKDKIDDLMNVISKLSSVKVESFDWLDKIDKSVINGIKNLTKIVKPLSKLSKKLDKYNFIDLSKLDAIQQAIKSLSKLKLDKVNVKIDENAIIRMSKSLKTVIKHLSKISNEMQYSNFNGFDKNIESVVHALNSLTQLSFDGVDDLDIDELDSLIQNDIPKKLTQISDQFSQTNTKNFKNAVSNVKYIDKFLSVFEDLSYNPNHKLDENALDDINVAIKNFVDISNQTSKINIDNESIKNIKKIKRILNVIKNIDTKDFANKDFDKIRSATESFLNISKCLDKLDGDISDKLKKFNEFVDSIFNSDDGIKGIINSLKDMDISNEDLNKVETISNLLNGLGESCKIIVAVGSMGKTAKGAIGIIVDYLNAINDFIKQITSIEDNKVKQAQDIIKGVGNLVLYSAICMLIGGAFIIFFPKIVLGALVFGLVLGIFIMTVLTSINIASSFGGGIKTTGETLKGVAHLIIMATFAMILGGAFILFFPKMVIASLAFGLALGLFLFITLGAINLASRGMNVAKETLREAGKLIIMASFVMILGAVFMMIPKLWKNSFKFTIALGLFIFATLGAINLATRGLRQSHKTIKELGMLVIISAFTMILGAAFMMIPGMALNAMLFTVMLGAFILAVLSAIKYGTKGVKKAKKNAEAFQLVVIVSAATLLAGGMLFVLFPELKWAVPLFGIILCGFVALMGVSMKTLSKGQKDIRKGAITMAILSGVVAIAAATLLIIKKATEGDLMSLLAGVGIIALIIIGAAGIAFGLGALMSTGVGALAFEAGIIALYQIVTIVGLASLALMGIAKAMDMLSKVKSFDAGPIVANLASLLSITDELAKFGLLSPIIIGASIAICSLSKCISEIAEAVHDVSSLKIPIYEGTKKVGYRQLTQKDFNNAGRNTKALVSILGKTIIDIYNKSPEMFAIPLMYDNPFTRVVKSVTGLAKMVSKISHAVKDFADLKIPEYTGTKITSYRRLTTNDFKFASENVKKVIETLSLPLIELYNKHPDIYSDKSLFGCVLGMKAGNTPMSMVISVTTKIGKLISKIASGVADMAELKIPIKYNDKGKAIDFRQMTNDDIINAGKNTKEIIETISNSLLELYDLHPDMYTDKSLFGSMFGEEPANTPMARILSISMKIGKLISKIASGVADMAELKIPIKYNDKGKAIDFKQMTNDDILQAGKNTKEIIESITNSLLELYENNKYMYDDNSIFSFVIGDKPENTPLSRVISVSMKIGKLMNKIASGVADMADLKIATKYNKNGKAIEYRQMTKGEIIQAGENVKEVVSIIGNALMQSYDEHGDWYEGDIKETPFYVVISVNQEMSKLICNIAKGIGSIAKLQIPEEYNKNGKPIKFRQLNENDFKMASENIGTVITVLGNAIMDQYENHPNWFQDNDGEILESKKSPFAIVMKATGEMGTLLCNLATGLKDYSKLQVPIKWNDKGKPIEYRQLDTNDFTNAAVNIGLVITCIGNSIMEMYEGHKDWFEDGGNIFAKQDSPFAKTLNSCVAMGDMISSISEGITSLAKLMIPTKWDPKTGKPIEFREMKNSDFDLASESIKKVVLIVGNTLLELYNNDTHGMFNSNENEDTPFTKIAQGCSYLGEMIKNIAEGVVEMATLENTLAKEGIKIDENTYTNASNNIAKVVTAIGGALMKTFDGHKDWFENPPLTKISVGFLKGSIEKIPNTADTPFQKIMQSSLLMGQLIISIATGIVFFSKMVGEPIELNGKKELINIDKANENIEKILLTIGNAIISTANSSKFHDSKHLESIMNSIIKSTIAVNNIANIIGKIGQGKIVTIDKDGKVINEVQLNDTTLKNSATLIGKILSTVTDGLELAKSSSEGKEFDPYNDSKSIENLNNILNVINRAITIVGKNAHTLALLSNFRLKYIDEDGKPDIVNVSTDSMKQGGEVIASVLENIGTGLSNAFDAVKYLLKVKFMEDTVNLIDKAMKIVSDNAILLRNIASNKFPIYGKDNELIDTYIITRTDLTTGADTIADVIKHIANGLYEGTKSVEELLNGYGSFENSKVAKMLTAVQKASNVVGNMAFFLANLAKNRYVYEKDDKQFSISFELEDFKSAGETIGTIISSIASGIGTGTESVATYFNNCTEFKDSKPAKMLTAVQSAKNVVGNMAFFLANLAKNRYVYFDAQSNELKEIDFGSLTELENAGTAISKIISSIAESIGSGTKSIGNAFGDDGIFSSGFEKSKVHQLLLGLTMAKDAIGPITLFISRLATGEYTYMKDGNEVSITFTTDLSKISAVTTSINTILTSLAKSIADAADKLFDWGFGGIGNRSNSKIWKMFASINKSVEMLGNVAEIVSCYANGEIASVKNDGNGDISIKRSGAPNVNTAKDNINTIVMGIVDVIKTSAETINKIKNIDETFKNLQKSIEIVNASTKVVEIIEKAKSTISSIEGFSFGKIMKPILVDISGVIDEMNKLGNIENNIGGIMNDALSSFSLGQKSSSPIQSFLNDVSSMVEQAYAIANAPMEKSFKTLNNTIISTMDTLSKVQIPENFGKQVKDLKTFINSVNSIRIDGVDSLTALLKELNKMGINMGNLDKLTSAIANKLTIVLEECGKIMKELDKTMKADWKRKDKHKQEIKNSVQEIQNIMGQTMEVLVKMDDSDSSSSGSSLSNDSNNDSTKESKQPAAQDGKSAVTPKPTDSKQKKNKK